MAGSEGGAGGVLRDAAASRSRQNANSDRDAIPGVTRFTCSRAVGLAGGIADVPLDSGELASGEPVGPPYAVDADGVAEARVGGDDDGVAEPAASGPEPADDPLVAGAAAGELGAG